MNLLFRILSAVLLLPIVIYVIWQGGIGFTCLMFVAFTISLFEYAAMVMNEQRVWQILTVFSGLLIVVLIPLISSPVDVVILLGFLCLGIGTYFTLNPDASVAQFETVCVLLFGIFYIGSGFLSIYLLRTGEGISGPSEVGMEFIFLVLIATWSNDTFAYFVGRQFGRRRLNVKISANKTWEGFCGGGIFTIIIPLVCRSLFVSLSDRDIFFVIVPIIFLAPLGDLIESRMKRFYGFKDSGKILPGHGGLLDRIDALLVTSLWAAAYVFFVRPMW